MDKILKNGLIFLSLAVSFIFITSCSNNDEDVRMPDNILGVWSPSDDVYLEFRENNTIRHLNIEMEDGETIGIISDDVFFFEPGYNLVVYISAQQTANVYKIITLTDSKLTWCWVDDITDEYEGDQNIGSIIGKIIQKAQEGYHLDPGRYEYFNKVPEVKFLEILENLDILDIW
ncbi:MAG: hypothetical protein J1E78_06325 [Muribaculaceae bacterium]|nr:hypothetical protein [Muribaculaceae bacterium]